MLQDGIGHHHDRLPVIAISIYRAHGLGASLLKSVLSQWAVRCCVPHEQRGSGRRGEPPDCDPVHMTSRQSPARPITLRHKHDGACSVARAEVGVWEYLPYAQISVDAGHLDGESGHSDEKTRLPRTEVPCIHLVRSHLLTMSCLTAESMHASALVICRVNRVL